MHFILLFSSSSSPRSAAAVAGVPSLSDGSFEFDFLSSIFGNSKGSASSDIGWMSSADELFLNDQIRPLKLPSHPRQRPLVLSPLLDVPESEDKGDCEEEDADVGERAVEVDRGDGEDSEVMFKSGRDMRLRFLRRRARSLSTLRNMASFYWGELADQKKEVVTGDETPKSVKMRAVETVVRLQLLVKRRR